jgi:hypothetical protein
MHPKTLKEAKELIRGIGANDWRNAGAVFNPIRGALGPYFVSKQWAFQIEAPKVVCHLTVCYSGFVFMAQAEAECGRKDTFDELRGKQIARGRAEAEIARDILPVAVKFGELEAFWGKVRAMQGNQDLQGFLALQVPKRDMLGALGEQAGLAMGWNALGGVLSAISRQDKECLMLDSCWDDIKSARWGHGTQTR